jgi:DNA-binding NarL/FixJ family response regulator
MAFPDRLTAPPELTAAELKVLRLLAQGATNKAIGARLSLSPHTVANHVHRILTKTNTANRTEAANCARRHRLVADEPGLEQNSPDPRAIK